MIRKHFKSILLVLAILAYSSPLRGQEGEIYIPGVNIKKPEMELTDNLLARCLATNMEEYCAGLSFSGSGENLKRSDLSEIALETFIIDLSDDQTGLAPKVVVKKIAATAGIRSNIATSKSVTALSVEVKFDFDSNKVSDDQGEKISMLAAAFSDQINQESRFAIIGHTDAKGSNVYNCGLSKKRAEAVKIMLLLNGAQSHLQSVGAGEALLKNNLEPDSADNRRVTFLKLGKNEVDTMTAFQALCK